MRLHPLLKSTHMFVKTRDLGEILEGRLDFKVKAFQYQVKEDIGAASNVFPRLQ